MNVRSALREIFGLLQQPLSPDNDKLQQDCPKRLWHIKCTISPRLKFRLAVRDALEALGLLETSRDIRRSLQDCLPWISWLSPRYRESIRFNKVAEERVVTFSRCYATLFERSSKEVPHGARRVLVVNGGSSRVEMELCLIKALKMAGCEFLLLSRSRIASQYYSLLGPNSFQLWRDFARTAFHKKAEAAINGHSLDEVRDMRFSGARVGGYSIASVRRNLKKGFLNIQVRKIRDQLIDSLATSLASVEEAKRILQEFQPSLLLLDDTAYTPRGEFLDLYTEAGIPVIRWFPAHNGSALILKRYRASNRDHDQNSLSDASWQIVRSMDWNNDRRQDLKREFHACYANGTWYGDAGTQFDKRFMEIDAVRARLHLDPAKKTAFIFSHISWDASFGRGQDLFASYEEWLVETVRAAYANDRVQWVVKIHPAHVFKSHGLCPAEEEIFRRRFGEPPPHITLLPADNDISTYSLFPVMDYCLTVRGTAGLEAACLGIPVLTGGVGRYDRKGFTVDSATPEQYLERIANIQDIPRLSPAQIELAERYAYGLFLLRPLALTSVTIEHRKLNGGVFNPVHINLRTQQDWEEAPDFRAFTDWVLNSDEEDFLLPVPTEPMTHRQNRREVLKV